MTRLKVLWYALTKKNFIFLGWSGNPDSKVIPEVHKDVKPVMYTSEIVDHDFALESLEKAGKVVTFMQQEEQNHVK